MTKVEHTEVEGAPLIAVTLYSLAPGQMPSPQNPPPDSIRRFLFVPRVGLRLAQELAAACQGVIDRDPDRNPPLP